MRAFASFFSESSAGLLSLYLGHLITTRGLPPALMIKVMRELKPVFLAAAILQVSLVRSVSGRPRATQFIIMCFISSGYCGLL